MNLRTEFIPGAGYLAVIATGKFSLKEAEQSFLDTLDAVIEHKTKKVLLDGRSVIGRPETIERFYYGKFVANSVKAYKSRGVSLATAFAYVLKEPLLDRQRFGETVAVNRGMHVRVFDAMEPALEWLDIAPPHRAHAGHPRPTGHG